MVEFEIETGMMARGGSWGYIVHAYDIDRRNAENWKWDYRGEWFSGSGFKSERAARNGARKMLDSEYGKGEWKHV